MSDKQAFCAESESAKIFLQCKSSLHMTEKRFKAAAECGQSSCFQKKSCLSTNVWALNLKLIVVIREVSNSCEAIETESNSPFFVFVKYLMFASMCVGVLPD